MYAEEFTFRGEFSQRSVINCHCNLGDRFLPYLDNEAWASSLQRGLNLVHRKRWFLNPCTCNCNCIVISPIYFGNDFHYSWELCGTLVGHSSCLRICNTSHIAIKRCKEEIKKVFLTLHYVVGKHEVVSNASHVRRGYWPLW